MNFKQKIYFLALQKYFSIYDLMECFQIELNDIMYLTKSLGREYPNLKIYSKDILIEREILPLEITRLILEDKKLSFSKLQNVFKINQRLLLKTTRSVLVKNRDAFQAVVRNSSFYSELKELFSSNIQSTSRYKNFFETIFNLIKLISLHRYVSIEEISLIFKCSPKRVEDELVTLGLGGFWSNESIRVNYPHFISDVKEEQFSISEIMYLLNNVNELNLHLKLNTTIKCIDIFKEKIKHLEMPKHDIVKELSLINSGDSVKRSSLRELEELIHFNKEKIGKKEYNISYLFNAVERSYLTEKSNLLENRLDILDREIVKESEHEFVLKDSVRVLGKIIFRDNKSFKVKGSEGILSIPIEKICMYRIKR